jgi:hypothetical protein
VKDLFSTMLLRPAQSANRYFVPQDDKLFKTSFPLHYPLRCSAMTKLLIYITPTPSKLLY